MKDPKHKYKFSNKTRAKMRKSHLGKKHSPETIAKIRAARKERDTLIAMGLLKPFKHSEATKLKLRKLALKQKRRHKLTKGERKQGALENHYKAADRKLKRQAEAGRFDL